MDKKRILVTAAGGGGTNNMINTVNDDSYSFIGCNIDKFKAACSFTDRTYLVPRASDERNYIDSIKKIIEKENLDGIAPNSDMEVEILAKYKDEINANLLLPSYEAAHICQDKMRMYDFCIEHDIPVAKTLHVKSFDELDRIEEEFDEYPLWCRIKSGAGSKHTSKIFSIPDAKHFISHVLEANKIDISEFLISELLPGDDYAVMTTWRDGELVLCKMAHRMHYFGKPGESPPYVIKTFFDQEVLDFAIETAKKFQDKPTGNYNFDIKKDKDNNIALTEINAGRFYYNMPIFNLTGPNNAFQIYLKTLMGEKVEGPLLEYDEKYFIRDMDNYPRVYSKSEIENKVITL
jgi:carbamoylphosphate synthase large subunit